MTATEYHLMEETRSDRSEYRELLLEGDGDSVVLATYMNSGRLFVLRDKQGMVVACALLTAGPDCTTVELKNIAVVSSIRGCGIGSILVHRLQVRCARQYEKMLVGTGDADVQNQLFYLKNGFRYSGVRRDFFATYQPPIISNGLPLRDMVLFTADLREVVPN